MQLKSGRSSPCPHLKQCERGALSEGMPHVRHHVFRPLQALMTAKALRDRLCIFWARCNSCISAVKA